MSIFNLARLPRAREVFGLLCVFVCLAALLSLATYDPADPSWNTASPADPPHNAIGRLGASAADLAFQTFGLSAWLLPLVLLATAWRSLRQSEPSSRLARLLGYALIALISCTLLALAAPRIPPRLAWSGSFAIGGTAGLLFSTTLTRYLNPTGTVLLLGALLFIALYLLSSFSLRGSGGWLGARLSAVLPVFHRRERGDSTALAVASDVAVAPRRSRHKAEPESDPIPVIPPPGLERDVEAYSDVEEPPFTPAPPEPAPYEPEDDTPPWVPAPEIPIRPLEETAPAAAPAPTEPRFSTPEPLPPPPPSLHAEPAPEPIRSTEWKLPATILLNPVPGREGYDSAELKEVAGRIKSKLEEFNVNGNVVQINPGPVVTTFEFKPDAGVKISRITTLSEDLCLGLQAESILIERIPGKPTVGIEVPNTRRETISLRQIIESDEFRSAPARLTFALGKDISGRIRVSELEKMPHLLIAGSTGSGKSVMLNTLIMSTLFRSTPDEVRMMLVDPKRVELGIYDGIPHLLTPVITEPKKAVNALRNAVLEMERRLKLLASYGVRNIDQFNKKIAKLQERPLSLFPGTEEEPANVERPLPYILIVIDELADLMMLERAGVEESVIRLAQMARAVGMHIVLATQRPSVDVITGLIKANFPARISFRVATRVDSRTVLDVMGAEHLLGRGDMLFLPPGTSRLLRVHGAFVTETEITDVVDFWRKQSPPDYDQSYLIAPPADEEEEPDEAEAGDEDPLYVDAVRIVCEMGKASTSILQRRLRLGYGRAARILDQMQREGIIGPPDGSRPRDILRRPDFLDAPED
jgi:S-DNA-T family DNA segregation ATPase FtsK/SpoIIIE